MLRLIRNFFKKTPEDKLSIEISRVEKALSRNIGKLDDMHRYWKEVGGVCCPSCMFGSKYSDLVDKVDRTEDLLKKLKKKRECGQ